MYWLYNESKLWWLLFLLGATLVYTWLQQTFFVSDILYYNTYDDRLSIETIELMIGSANRYGWLSYIITPLLLLLRVTLVACCFYTTLFFKNEKFEFESCYNIALKSDTAFLVFGLFNLMYRIAVPATNLMELSGNPVSLLYYVHAENVPQYLLYPLGLINLGEFFYWGLMVGLIRFRYKYAPSEAFSFVLSSYGVGLLAMTLFFALILI